jgi:hypothetical protein
MDETIARSLFGFSPNEPITSEMYKKKYKRLALQYHPDKNPSTDASVQFIQINNAYQWFNRKNNYSGLESLVDYKSVFLSFIKHVWPEPDDTLYETLFLLFTKLSSLCSLLTKEDVTPLLKKWVEPIDKDILIKIHAIIAKYRDVFHVSDFLYDVLSEVIREKESSCFRLYPFLDDLLDEKLFKWENGEQTFVVPLWHHELIYDENVRIQCVPLLPENIRIDSDNHIYVSLFFTIDEIFNMDEIRVELGDHHVLFFERGLLHMKKKQMHRMKGKGIPKINSVDVFDVSKRGDVFVMLTIV